MVALAPGGAELNVTLANRAAFVAAAESARLSEIDEQCAAIRCGESGSVAWSLPE